MFRTKMMALRQHAKWWVRVFPGLADFVLVSRLDLHVPPSLDSKWSGANCWCCSAVQIRSGGSKLEIRRRRWRQRELTMVPLVPAQSAISQLVWPTVGLEADRGVAEFVGGDVRVDVGGSAKAAHADGELFSADWLADAADGDKVLLGPGGAGVGLEGRAIVGPLLEAGDCGLVDAESDFVLENRRQALLHLRTWLPPIGRLP